MPALTYAYGAFVAIGGMLGYLGRGSKASLGWGLLFGTIICFSGLRMKDRGPGVRGYPYALALLSSACLAGLSSYRFIKTGKVWPMGVLMAISIAMSLRYTAHFTVYNDLYEYGI